MGAVVFVVLAAFGIVLAGVFQIYIGTNLKTWGFGRVIELYGPREGCYTVPDLPGCEKIVLHQLSGTLYMACGGIEQREAWITHSAKYEDYAPTSDNNFLATYDAHDKVTRLVLKGFDNSRTAAFHGMDVVPSSHSHNELFVYLVHNRLPSDGQDPASVGFDTCIEIFRTYIGSNTLTHVTTVESPYMITPNDVVGSSDGKSFYFTNMGSVKVGKLRRFLSDLFTPSGSIVHCHVDTGCKIALSKVQSANGLVAAPNGTIYVANSMTGGIRVLDRQEDDSLVLDDLIATETIVDNLSLDRDGMLWAAGFPRMGNTVATLRNSSIPCPSAAYKVSINTGLSAFYGEKYRVEKMFEDDGKLVSLATTVVHDAERHRLYFHGLMSTWLTVCPTPKYESTNVEEEDIDEYSMD